MLGFLGGLAAIQPDDWPARLKAAERVVAAGTAAPRPWRLLTSPDVARVIVAHEADETSGLLSIACLDPAGNGIEPSPPRIELRPPRTREIRRPPLADRSAALLSSCGKNFGGRAGRGFRRGTPRRVSRQMDRGASHPSHKPPRRRAPGADRRPRWRQFPVASARFPKSTEFRKPRAGPASRPPKPAGPSRIPPPRAMPCRSHSNRTNPRRSGCFNFSPPGNPTALNHEPSISKRSADGWLWSPDPDLKVREKLQGWVDSETQLWRDQWQDRLLTDTPC